MDLFIIIFSVSSLISTTTSLKTFKILRILRLISRNEGLKIAVQALIRAIPNILNVTLIMFLFLLIFGVILVSQFKGKFFTCIEDGVDVSMLDEYGDVNSKWDCLN